MASTVIQTAQTDWRRRANEFRSANIPDSTWTKLYNQDITNVDNGGQPMSDAEVFAGIQSAVHGPQIQDPTRQHGGHGLFSGITDTLGNIGSDISGIVTGWPAGVESVARHFPSEVTNTAKLLDHLAKGDNNWLISHGYLKNGDRLHESWGDFATILRAMNANGSKQLLPYLPFISDAAELTSHQGRNMMMQHPVGSFLDVLPGIAKAGELATAGRDFGYVSELNGKFMKVSAEDAAPITAQYKAGLISKSTYEAALKDAAKEMPYGQNEPRFWAAGRALQKGNPVKAVVSAVGDVIPGGLGQGAFDTETLTDVTLRQRMNTIAAANGMARWQREGILRNFHIQNSEYKMSVSDWAKQTFSKSAFDGMSADRTQYLWLVAEAFVNPETGESFRNNADYNTFVDTHLTDEERGGLTAAATIAERQRREAITKGWLTNVPYSDVIYRYTGFRPTANTMIALPFDHPIVKKYNQVLAEDQAALDALQRHSQNAGTQAGADALNSYISHKQKGARYEEEMARLQASHLPGEWQAAVAAHIRSAGKQTLTKTMLAQQLNGVLKAVDNSVFEKEFERLFPNGGYDKLKSDAVKWWLDLAGKGHSPLWLQTTDVDVMDKIMAPRLRTASKLERPEHLRPKDMGVYFGDTVMDIAAALTAQQVEVMHHEFVGSYLNNYILPRSYKGEDKQREYQNAYSQAKARGAKNLPPVTKLMRDNFVPFKPSSYGLNDTDLPDTFKDLVVDKDTDKILREMVTPSKLIQMGGRVVTKGTSLYKFAVLTGVRHWAHVTFGGLAYMMLAAPLAPFEFFNAVKVMRAANGKGDVSVLDAHGLVGKTLSGLKQDYYQLGRPTWNGARISPVSGHLFLTGANMGQDVAIDWIHQAAKQGAKVAEFIPNKLSQLEEITTTMYKIMTMLSKERWGADAAGAIEAANRLYVDVNGMSMMEQRIVKQIFPFYAFTRHLFRYLMNFPVDYPVRAAILANFAEGEQQNWTSGLPRSYNMLYHIGHPNAAGDQWTIDLKNTNPFRSFANDWSMAGFTSSLSPFLSGTLSAIGVDTLSGTTQLYPGMTYNAQYGTLQATQQPGWEMSVPEAFVPQLGILDHYLKLTQSTRLMATYNKDAYQSQLYDMLNLPFIWEVKNIPYEKEVTEMRRFRAAQAAVTLVEKNPSAGNISKLMTFNAVPFDNELVAPQAAAQYYQRVAQVLAAMGEGGISPKAAARKPPTRKAQLSGAEVGTAPANPFLGGAVNVPAIPSPVPTSG